MDLADVVFAGDRKIPRLHNSSVDVLAPVLSHLFFVDNSQKLRHELRVDRQQLDQFVPNREDLVCDYFDVPRDQGCDLLRVTLAG